MADGCEYDEDFEEDEVWAVTADVKKAGTTSTRAKDPFRHAYASASSSSSSSTSSSRLTTGGTASTVPICSPSSNVTTKSAPVSIPERSKIYNIVGRGRQGLGDHNSQACTDDYKDDEDEGDDDRAPPHEWLAKKMERSQISSSSVCQGAGRTLKGRDLTKDAGGVYKPPRFAPTSMDEDKISKQEKQALRREKTMLRQAKESAYVKDLMDDFEDRPEEIRENVGAESIELTRYLAKQELRAKQEEEFFTRAPVSKRDKKMEKHMKSKNGLLGMTDGFFDEIKMLPLEKEDNETSSQMKIDKGSKRFKKR